MKKLILALCAALFATTALAQSVEADIKKKVGAALDGATVDEVNKLDALNLYEVVIGSEVIYTDAKASYIMVGQVIDPKTKRNLTEERLNKLSSNALKDLPLDLAIKQVKGNGKRVITTFEDPNCGYCRKLAVELRDMTDITIYTFLFPILSEDSVDKAKAIWCAPDRAKAWNGYMLNRTAPPAAKCDTTELVKIMAVARKLRVNGTPAIFLADGTRLPGFMPKEELEQALTRAADNASKR